MGKESAGSKEREREAWELINKERRKKRINGGLEGRSGRSILWNY